jgi:hypothetical protein
MQSKLNDKYLNIISGRNAKQLPAKLIPADTSKVDLAI